MVSIATTKTNNNAKLTPFEEQNIKALKKISEFSLRCQANIVSIYYKNPDLLYETTLTIKDFSSNVWKVFFAICRGVIIHEKKNTLDEITVLSYLEKHEKLKEKYNEYGGFEVIESAKAYVNESNLDGYVDELKKWGVVIKLAKSGFPVADRLSDYADMSSEEIYDELEAVLNHTFLNVDSEIKSYNACDKVHEFIDNMNKGDGVGMPLHNAPILTKEIGGLNFNGHIYGLGAASGVGKSTMAINYIIPSVLKYNEKVVFIINEEDESKIQRELIIWCANNHFKEELHKYVLRDGKFTDEVMDLLRRCADWIEEKKDSKHITVIPLEKYSVKIAIKIIKKYNSIGGVRCFVLDTLKESSDATTDDIHKSMMRDMVDLYNVVKPKAKNVFLLVTYQLNKASLKQRYLTNHEIGQSKAIVDVMSVNLMMRPPLQDEFKDGKKKLICYKLEGKNGRSKIPFYLDPDKHYMITFKPKNRFGASNDFQIVSECDLSRNINRDLGICYVEQDW